MTKAHFKVHQDDGRIGRVEFLPVKWHEALHGDATGIDRYCAIFGYVLLIGDKSERIFLHFIFCLLSTECSVPLKCALCLDYHNLIK